MAERKPVKASSRRSTPPRLPVIPAALAHPRLVHGFLVVVDQQAVAAPYAATSDLAGLTAIFKRALTADGGGREWPAEDAIFH